MCGLARHPARHLEQRGSGFAVHIRRRATRESARGARNCDPGACRLDVGLVRRRDRLADVRTNGGRSVEQFGRSQPPGLCEQSGHDLHRLDQHPPIGLGIDHRERRLEMNAGAWDLPLVEVEPGEVNVAKCDRRPGADGFAGVDRGLRASACDGGASKRPRDRGQAVRHRAFHGLMAELPEQLERLVTRVESGVKLAALPLREQQGGERLAPCQRVATADGDP